MDEEQNIPELLIFTVILLVIFLVFRGKSITNIDSALFWDINLLMLFFCGQYVIWFFRYHMPVVVTDGCHGSVGQRPIVIGDWAIFQVGEVFDPVHIHGKLQTLIVPVCSIIRFNRCYVSFTKVRRIPFRNLPQDVYRYIQRNTGDYNIKKMYFGKYCQEILNENPKIPNYEEQIENLNRMINDRNDIIEDKTDLLEGQINLGKKLTGDSWWKNAFRPKPPEGPVQ